MAGNEILKEGRVGSMIKKTASKAENNNDSGKTDFKPEYIKIRRFKIHESCYTCIYVALHTFTIIKTKMEVTPWANQGTVWRLPRAIGECPFSQP